MKLINISTNLKDLNVYKKTDNGLHTTLKGSNVCRIDNACFHSTPMGSHPSHVMFFYKHQIPSGLFSVIKLEAIEANIQKGLAELKK